MTIKTTGPNVHPAFRTAFRTEASSKTNLTKIFRPANLSARIRRQNAARSAKNACATTSRFLQGRKRTSGEDASAYRTYYIEKPPAAALLPRHRASSAGCRNRSPTGHRTATLPTRRCDRIEKLSPVAPSKPPLPTRRHSTHGARPKAGSEYPTRCGIDHRPEPPSAPGEDGRILRRNGTDDKTTRMNHPLRRSFRATAASCASSRNRSPTGHRTATLPTRRCDRIEKQGPVAPRNRLCRQAAVPTASSAFEASSECPARCGKPADRPFPQRAFGENFPAGIGSRRMRRISIVFLTNFVTFVSKNWLTPTRTGLPPDIRYSFRRDSCPEELAYANANRATARYSLFFSTR